MAKVKWGVLSTADIARKKVVPAMLRGRNLEVVAVASRNQDKAEDFAKALGLPKTHGSYEDLLADSDVECVYIPLPNHMHVPWAIKALQAGKHVLCEKPVAMNAGQARELVEEASKHPGLKIMEAFMYRHHPQWIEAKRIVHSGGVGELRSVQSFFSYFNVDPGNIRNSVKAGGGAMMDIGCYCVSLARFLFDAEPDSIRGLVDIDPRFGTDRTCTGIMAFGERSASFACSTQLEDYQRVNILGDKGRVEIMIPFNAPPDEPCILLHQQGDKIETREFPICDQYTIQAELMSQAILDDTAVPTPLADAVANMRVIDAFLGRDRKPEGGWTSSG